MVKGARLDTCWGGAFSVQNMQSRYPYYMPMNLSEVKLHCTYANTFHCWQCRFSYNRAPMNVVIAYMASWVTLPLAAGVIQDGVLLKMVGKSAM